MNALIPKHSEYVTGELSGWDRIVFRGYLRMLCFADGMMGYLSHVGVLLKDFGEHGKAMTERLIEASTAAAKEANRPIEYLPSPKIRKDEYARNIALCGVLNLFGQCSRGGRISEMSKESSLWRRRNDGWLGRRNRSCSGC